MVGAGTKTENASQERYERIATLDASGLKILLTDLLAI